MSQYARSSYGRSFPLSGVQASLMPTNEAVGGGNGNNAPPQTDLVNGAATNPMAHAAAARAAGIYTAAQGATSHPLFWGVLAIQLGFVMLGILAHAES